MVEYSEETLTRVYAALADPTHRAMLVRLQHQQLRVTELAIEKHSQGWRSIVEKLAAYLSR